MTEYGIVDYYGKYRLCKIISIGGERVHINLGDVTQDGYAGFSRRGEYISRGQLLFVGNFEEILTKWNKNFNNHPT